MGEAHPGIVKLALVVIPVVAHADVEAVAEIMFMLSHTDRLRRQMADRCFSDDATRTARAAPRCFPSRKTAVPRADKKALPGREALASGPQWV